MKLSKIKEIPPRTYWHNEATDFTPWVQYTTDNEVIDKSCSKNFNGLYAIQSNHIILDEEWWDYIEAHYIEICDFAMRSFIEYAKKYNNDMKLVKLMTTGWQMLRNK